MFRNFVIHSFVLQDFNHDIQGLNGQTVLYIDKHKKILYKSNIIYKPKYKFIESLLKSLKYDKK